jgi:hypothetical protein
LPTTPNGRSVVMVVRPRWAIAICMLALVGGGSLVRNYLSLPTWKPNRDSAVARWNANRLRAARTSGVRWGNHGRCPPAEETPRIAWWRMPRNPPGPGHQDGTSWLQATRQPAHSFVCNGNRRQRPPGFTKPDRFLHRQPAFAPHGRQVVFVLRRQRTPDSELAVRELASGAVLSLTQERTLASSRRMVERQLHLFRVLAAVARTNSWRIKPDGGPHRPGASHERVMGPPTWTLIVSARRQQRLVDSPACIRTGISKRSCSTLPHRVRQLHSPMWPAAETMPCYSPDGELSIAYFSSRQGC